MHVVTMVLVFLLAVVVCSFLARMLPFKVPLPLLQIGIGACLSYVFGFDVALDPHVFFLLFIPPLLFLDGWRIPKGAFFRDRRPILTLAIGLVMFTVVGVGLLIDWLIPAIPLAVAFALAAILSPTDPVAVGAMTANTPLPSRLTHILEGESLLNDATGLVCFTFAVAAAMTGSFSLANASLSFVLVAGGGLLIGVAVTWIIGTINRHLVRRVGEDPATQILISLLVPFAAYLVAEEVHVSGILAAAVAGIAMHYAEMSGRSLAATRMQRNAVWDTVQVSLNGIIFVLLGEQLPGMLRRLPEVSENLGTTSTWHMLAYVVIITLALGALRFAWVWISMRMTIFRAAWRGERKTMPQTRLLAVTATAGVRGAITLAGILTLPLLLPDGSPFPAREAAIFLAMGVILLSLIIASIGMPILARGLHADLPQNQHGDSESNARIATTEAAMRKIETLLAEPVEDPKAAALHAEAATHLMDVYRRRLQHADPGIENAADVQNLADVERDMRLLALGAERQELYRLRRSHSIDDGVHRQLLREIDLLEVSLSRAGNH